MFAQKIGVKLPANPRQMQDWNHRPGKISVNLGFRRGGIPQREQTLPFPPVAVLAGMGNCFGKKLGQAGQPVGVFLQHRLALKAREGFQQDGLNQKQRIRAGAACRPREFHGLIRQRRKKFQRGPRRQV